MLGDSKNLRVGEKQYCKLLNRGKCVQNVLYVCSTGLNRRKSFFSYHLLSSCLLSVVRIQNREGHKSKMHKDTGTFQRVFPRLTAEITKRVFG